MLCAKQVTHVLYICNQTFAVDTSYSFLVTKTAVCKATRVDEREARGYCMMYYSVACNQG